MKTNLNFEDKDTKKLLSKLDFEYFLNQNIEKEKYSDENIKSIHLGFENTNKIIKSKVQNNKKQYNLYVEGQVRKMFTGGLLPAIFELDGGRRNTFVDFPAVGENWAYFKHWQTYYKRKITREKVWDILTKTGTILAFILSLMKLFEYINFKNL